MGPPKCVRFSPHVLLLWLFSVFFFIKAKVKLLSIIEKNPKKPGRCDTDGLASTEMKQIRKQMFYHVKGYLKESL